MNQIWKMVIETIMGILISSLCATLSVGAKHAIQFIKNKTKNEVLKNALNEYEKIILEGIYYTEQVYTRKLKQNGLWDADAQNTALNTCLTYVRENLSSVSKEVLQEQVDDFDNYIISSIESNLGKLHTIATSCNSSSEFETIDNAEA